MKLEELKQGDTIFDVSLKGITRYEYLMLYPFYNPVNIKVKGYHILINKSLEEPLRMYYTQIEKILEHSCFTYEDAKKREIELVGKHLEYLKLR